MFRLEAVEEEFEQKKVKSHHINCVICLLHTTIVMYMRYMRGISVHCTNVQTLFPKKNILADQMRLVEKRQQSPFQSLEYQMWWGGGCINSLPSFYVYSCGNRNANHYHHDKNDGHHGMMAIRRDWWRSTNERGEDLRRPFRGLKGARFPSPRFVADICLESEKVAKVGQSAWQVPDFPAGCSTFDIVHKP